MSAHDDIFDRFLRRREALLGLGAAGLATLLLGRGRLGPLPMFDTPEALAATACTLDPEVTEGPYWIENSLTRHDIREDRKGLLLKLTLTVLSSSTCKAISGADVEIWHADASGLYSGFGTSAGQGTTNTKRYLRGHQKSNSDGQVQFLTIYPSWYTTRSPHIHLKVHVGGNTVHTGQLFLTDAISDAVYRTSSYKSHGQPDTTNSQDSIYKQASGSQALVKLTRRGTSLSKSYNGSAVLAVKPTRAGAATSQAGKWTLMWMR